MRPLFHPALEEITVEGILHALADPVRLAIYGEVMASELSSNCSSFTSVSRRTIPKSTLSQHFKVLREAGLVRGERQGVEMMNSSRCREIETRFPGLIMAILNAYKVQEQGRAENGFERSSRSASGGRIVAAQ